MWRNIQNYYKTYKIFSGSLNYLAVGVRALIVLIVLKYLLVLQNYVNYMNH